MTNRPKNIGTAGETAVVRYATAHGFPLAERRALAGNSDLGDIALTVGVIVEVKAGKVAEQCADAWLVEAQRQTLAEKANARADVALLVCKRKAVGAANAGQWWAWMPAWQLVDLACQDTSPAGVYDMPNPWVRMTLADALRLLRWGGHGNPLSDVEELAA